MAASLDMPTLPIRERTVCRPRLAGGATGLCLALVACSAGSTESGAAADPIPVTETGATPAYTVRGRWPDASRITYHIDDARRADLAPGQDLRASVERALQVWGAEPGVGFEPATDIQGADILFSFEPSYHPGCTSFGKDTSVAHAGAPGAGTFVHFDAQRAWGTEHSLDFAALHETGHVLGLDHTEHASSLMYVAAQEGQARFGDGERAGIASLYGGAMEAHPSDLWVRASDGQERVMLWRAAPPENTDFAVFDANGDGRDEVVVWRTDVAGAGILSLYFFNDHLDLVRTVGPLWGAVIPGSVVTLAHLPSGHRMLSCTAPGAAAVERGFDGRGLLTQVIPGARSSASRVAGRAGDLNGDGASETVRRP
ncbi:MAG: hypothetical protein ACI8QZ_001623 [Chlamydiales bacterium]|jgi:hypothetical protein